MIASPHIRLPSLTVIVPYGGDGGGSSTTLAEDAAARGFVLHQRNGDGTLRLMDPFGDGRLRSDVFPATTRLSADVPLVAVDPQAAANYRLGTVTVGADELPFMQRAFVGSGAHRDMYSTRHQVENVNGRLRGFTDLGPGYHPSFSLPRRSLFLAALVAGHNIREQQRWGRATHASVERVDNADGPGRRKRRSDARQGWTMSTETRDDRT